MRREHLGNIYSSHFSAKKPKTIEFNRSKLFPETFYLNAHTHCANTLTTLNPQPVFIHNSGSTEFTRIIKKKEKIRDSNVPSFIIVWFLYFPAQNRQDGSEPNWKRKM